ncbi:UNKNOWN [Stylonychia lemnae]|uniref:Uncharacterized protein n=1 Tax=Stylonychia lemnae TaxID=5949 RepID=A0A078A0B8_STYLE|nr:UNKNOWN [Stylonychia lemnae]|eukprot:CDW74228.1 UNKNOWN [Stylonychia lemnae]
MQKAAFSKPTALKTQPKMGFDVLYEFKKRTMERVDAAQKNIKWLPLKDPKKEVLNQMKGIINDMANLITDQSFIELVDTFKKDIGYRDPLFDETQRLGIIKQENVSILRDQFQYQLNKVKLEQKLHNQENLEALAKLGTKIEILKNQEGSQSSEIHKDVSSIKDQTSYMMSQIDQIKNMLQNQELKHRLTFKITKDAIERSQSITAAHQFEEVKDQSKQDESVLNDLKVERVTQILNEVIQQHGEQASTYLNLKELLVFLQSNNSELVDQRSFNFTYSQADLGTFKRRSSFDESRIDSDEDDAFQIAKQDSIDRSESGQDTGKHSSGSHSFRVFETRNSFLQQTAKNSNFDSVIQQNCLFQNSDKNIIIGLNQSWSKVQQIDDGDTFKKLELGASLISMFKVQNYLICGLSNSELKILNSDQYEQVAVVKLNCRANKYLAQHVPALGSCLFVFCENGFIEIISIQDFKLIQTIQHKSKLSISDAQRTQNQDEYMLSFAQQEKGTFTNGMLAAIKIKPKQISSYEFDGEFQFQYEEVANSEKVFLKDGKPQPVFCFQEIIPDIYLVCTTEKYFKYYDRRSKQIDSSKDIFNPSEAINYNCLQKVAFFSNKHPYLIYKDSRSIGFINCVTNEIQKLFDCTYKRGGNLHSMIQEAQSEDTLEIVSLIYKPKDNLGPEERKFGHYSITFE